ncbi:MAG TPA: carboxypeptidase-like regulatory domain-containing protein [Acidobacteriaceae bacterium]
MRSRTSMLTILALTISLAAPGFTVFCVAASGSASPHNAILSGVVRDSQGVPQMGAIIQLLTADATTVATAFTDDHGRYIIQAVLPGSYQLRATAAFFLPASRQNVRLLAGAQAIVNLTMSTMGEAANWLPAQKRRAEEPVDDWKWTLRSSANRPLLRLADDDILVSSSADNAHKSSVRGEVSVTSGDGGFGQGGIHQILLLDRTIENGDGAVLRADVSGSRSPYPVSPSAEIVAGYERRSPFGGSTRMVTSFQSHPELTDGASAGAQIMRMASTEEFKFGDTIVLDAGSLLQAERMEFTRLSSEPFVRLEVHPSDGLLIEYRFASGRDLQSSDDLDNLKPTLRLLTDGSGRPLSTKGSHHEVSISHKFGNRAIQLAAYTDHLDNVAINGSGVLDAGDLASIAAILADPTTGRFALASPNYSGHGVGISLVQPITPSLAAWFGYDRGTAMESDLDPTSPVAGAVKGISTHNTYAASASLRGKILRTGTTVRTEYRWQPPRTLTQVNAFNAPAQDAYFGIYVRQRLWCGHLIPGGIDAVIEATNLLEQGYQPVVASDGHLVFLAQAPRAIQGGFAFNF